jgi:hypothetical protein
MACDAVRTLAAVLLLTVLAALPFLFRAAERQRLLGPWQGEWLETDGSRVEVRGGDLFLYLPHSGPVQFHYDVGRIGPARVEL